MTEDRQLTLKLLKTLKRVIEGISSHAVESQEALAGPQSICIDAVGDVKNPILTILKACRASLM